MLGKYISYLRGLRHIDIASLEILLSKPNQLIEYIRFCRKNYFLLMDKGLPQKDMYEAIPEISKNQNMVNLLTESSHGGGMTKYELFFLCSLVSSVKPSSVLEIGTFNGYAMTHIVLNSKPIEGKRFYTLDLPQENSEVALRDRFTESDRTLIEKRRPGYFYRKYGLADKVTQLWGDSADFDFTPFYNSIDLVIVDGAHSYDYIKNDSHHAFLMVKPDGIILWHDYAASAGYEGNQINMSIRELAEERDIFHIKDTNFAFYRNGVGV